jgi:hypothetical protein
MAVDPTKCWPHVPDHADLVNDVSGTEYVLLHCARCGSEVALKLDAERNILEQWILPDAA